MQPRPALSLAACGALLAASTLGTTSARAAAEPAAEAPCHASPGLTVNRWVGKTEPGQISLWNNNKNWSLGRFPRADSEKQVVCIRSAARVVLDKNADLEVHVAAIDIGGTAAGPGQLVLLPGNSLFVEAPGRKAVSRIQPGSRLKLKGAVVGGHGRLEIAGELNLDAAPGRANVVTTRPCGAVPVPEPGSCSTKWSGHGTISVVGHGLFRVNRGPTTVTDGYHVLTAGGELVIQGGSGQVVADGGTRLALRRNTSDDLAPALTFLNDGGWYAGADPFLRGPTRVRIHSGIVAKQEGNGTSSIQGHVSASDQVRADVRSGQLAIAGIDPSAITSVLSANSSYSTGSCAPDSAAYGCTPTATAADTQIASVSLPRRAESGELTITEESTDATTLGAATVIEGYDAEVSRTSPLLLELRYDASIIGGRTPSTTPVLVAQKKTFRTLADCLSSGAVPKGKGACVDRRAGQSRFEADGDLVMVVRTQHFSRYICF